MRNNLFILSILLNLIQFVHSVRADFNPIPITAESFNQDVVVEKTAQAPIPPATNASMETGAVNDGFSFYERGYYSEFPATGLPLAGSLLTSDAAPDHQYLLAPSYRSNNVVLIDATFTNAIFILRAPSAVTALSLLVSSCGGGLVQYVVHHQDQSQESGVVILPHWYGGAVPAWAANGRVHVVGFYFDSLNSDNPRLFSVDFALTNTLAPVTAVEFRYAGSASHHAIFAVSGAIFPGDGFTPLVVTGYNADVVVEASASRTGFLNYVTSATMDSGSANNRTTWYEQGYNPLAPSTGLPAPGSVFHSESSPDHVYQMPPSYSENNAVVTDSDVTNATVNLVVPTKCSILSFLTGSGHGPVTNQCVLQHADGSSQTNLVVSPNWFEPAQPALTANGRISISTRLVDWVGGGYPRLYSADLAVRNKVSAITNISLTYVGAIGKDAHAAVFAVSGQADAGPLLAPSLSIVPGRTGSLIIHSSSAGLLQSTTSLDGDRTLWQDAGNIGQNWELIPQAVEAVRFYRVVVIPGL